MGDPVKTKTNIHAAKKASHSLHNGNTMARDKPSTLPFFPSFLLFFLPSSFLSSLRLCAFA